MKKVFMGLILISMLFRVAFADVVGPVNGLPGALGVEYMHGKGVVFYLPAYLIMMCLLLVIMTVIMIIITKIMKKNNADVKKIKITRMVFLGIYIVFVIASIIIVCSNID